MTTLTSIGIGVVLRRMRTNSVGRVASQAPISITEAETSIVALRAQLTDGAAPARAEMTRVLRELHQLLMRAAAATADPPLPCLEQARLVVEAVSADVTDAMSARPRTVFRLLRAGSLDAAWQVEVESATGVVADPFDASTATGASRTSWRLPLLTRIEAGTVYAELPGFRDPRYDADDRCYDITDTIALQVHLDQVEVGGTTVLLGGWAALDVLAAGVGESVAVVVSRDPAELLVPAARVRRADLVSGRGEALTRRAFAGWSASLDLTDPRLDVGTWDLSVEIDHEGVRRRAPLGHSVSDLARAAATESMRAGRRTARWDISGPLWRLVVSAA
jgi:hypothetical protein